MGIAESMRKRDGYRIMRLLEHKDLDAPILAFAQEYDLTAIESVWLSRLLEPCAFRYLSERYKYSRATLTYYLKQICLKTKQKDRVNVIGLYYAYLFNRVYGGIEISTESFVAKYQLTSEEEITFAQILSGKDVDSINFKAKIDRDVALRIFDKTQIANTTALAIMFYEHLLNEHRQ